GRPDGELRVEPHGEGIHRDRPDPLTQLAAAPHLAPGEVSPEAVAVPDGHDADPGWLVCDEAAAVACALTGLQALHLGEKALPRQHRLQPVLGGVAVEPPGPVDSDPPTND